MRWPAGSPDQLDANIQTSARLAVIVRVMLTDTSYALQTDSRQLANWYSSNMKGSIWKLLLEWIPDIIGTSAVILSRSPPFPPGHPKMPTSQFTVSGTIHHPDMDAVAVLAKIKARFPNAAIGGMDFIIPLGDCEAEFFRAHSAELEFHVRPVSSRGLGGPNPARAVTATEMLVRATETLWFGLEKSLRTGGWRHRRPTLVRCSIEDVNTTTALLARETQSPLLSSGAKVAYIFSILYILAATILIYWQFMTPNSKGVRQANVLGISLALFVAAVSTPVPLFMSWREWKGNLSWKYVRSTR